MIKSDKKSEILDTFKILINGSTEIIKIKSLRLKP